MHTLLGELRSASRPFVLAISTAFTKNRSKALLTFLIYGRSTRYLTKKSMPNPQLGGRHKTWSLCASMNDAFALFCKQLVQDQRIRLLAHGPKDHEHDHLQILQAHRSARNGQHPVQDHFALRGREHAG